MDPKAQGIDGAAGIEHRGRFDLIVMAGVGEPDEANCPWVSSTSSLLQGLPKQLANVSGGGPPPVTIHMSPEDVKEMSGPPVEEMMTVGAGSGVPSSSLGNSTRHA